MSEETISYFDALISQVEVLNLYLPPSDVVPVAALLYNARLIAIQKTIRLDITPNVASLLNTVVTDRPKVIYYLVYDLFSYVHNFPAYGHWYCDVIAEKILNAPNVQSANFYTFLFTFQATASYNSARASIDQVIALYTGDIYKYFNRLIKASNHTSNTVFKTLRDKAKLSQYKL